MTEIRIEDNSGDREFFTIIPNFVLNHSSSTDQSLYLQMKRFAGEEGRCFATQETLIKKLGIGLKSYRKSLDYLIKKGWIEFIGMTEGKTRPIKTYKINNIWQENSEYYKKIPAESTIEEEPYRRRSIKKRGTSQELTNTEKTKRSSVELLPKRGKTPQELSNDFFLKGESYTEFVKFLLGRGMTEPVAVRETAKFISYWTERNSTGVRERWEIEKTFEIKRRLSTWFSKANQFNKSDFNNKYKPSMV